MKNNMIKFVGTLPLYGTIGVFDQASIIAIGNDVVVTDVMPSGRFRYRQVLENTRVQDVDFDAEILFVSKAMRRKLHHLFDNEEMKHGKGPHHAEWSEHKLSAPGDFKPLVKKGEVLVADFSMSGTHYFRLTMEDRAWLEHREGLKI